MPKGYIRCTDSDGNNVPEFGTDYVKRRFLQNTDLLRDALKEPWRARMLRISLLMDPKVRKNFLRASKRRQKLMIEHMRGFMIMYHTGSGKIAPCTQGHNGPYRHREVLLIEEFYPTTVYDPEKFEQYYTPKEGEVTLHMRFNDPERKPEIVPYTMGNMDRVLGIDPSITGEPDVIWIEHAHPVKTVKNVTIQKGVDGELTHLVHDGDKVDAVVKVGNPEFDIFLTREDLHPAVAETLDKHRAELDKLITAYPGTYNPSFSIRAPQQPNTLSDGTEIELTDLLNPIKE